ncbi:V-type ATP synthase subunit D [Nocardia australiensis]|uniref:V-type ATP synthase subunit D n=1 Tax=Nocardia australiensis TaxID=2887191 RepID=UPI001D135D7B|nr:V-type ATP synthase subunit D [Nocardia australiensis]
MPPGHAGRQWLRERLELAERGAGLLEDKLRILRPQRQRLRARVHETARAWQHHCREAQTWTVRATLLSGQRAVRLAAPERATTVTLTSTATVGIRYPEQATCTFPPETDPTAVTSSSAVSMAQRAHRDAVDAAADHAVALAGLRIVEREFAATQLRARALRKRWLPRLHAALVQLELHLEEQERAEAIDRKLAAAPRDNGIATVGRADSQGC